MTYMAVALDTYSKKIVVSWKYCKTVEKNIVSLIVKIAHICDNTWIKH